MHIYTYSSMLFLLKEKKKCYDILMAGLIYSHECPHT